MKDRTVLVVDDDTPSVELVEAYLDPEGCRVLKAYDGEEALRSIRTDPPDLILLDVNMPRLDGRSVCRQLKADESTRFIPIVVISSLRDKSEKIRSLEAGADDVLSKPVDRLELVTRARSLVRMKVLHDDLEGSYQKLKAAESAREFLLQMIVHDLKNPLTAVETNLELMAMKRMEDCWQYLDMSRHSCRVLYHMIQDLFEVSKMEEGALPLRTQSVQVRELIEACAREFEVSARLRSKEIALEIAPDLPPVRGDSELLFRVSFNLMANAVRYTGKGGRIRVRARMEEGGLRVEVADEGAPIPDEYIGQIFDKYVYRETGYHVGKGLRLTFCKMAVEAHGGRIWAERGAEKGNRFVFVLPVEVAEG